MRVVVVDDEADILELFQFFLEDAGHEVIPFSDSRKAVEWADGNNQADVLLTDVNMPHIKGDQLVHHFHKHYPQLSICMISGHMDVEADYRTRLPNIDIHFLIKPVSGVKLVEWVNSVKPK